MVQCMTGMESYYNMVFLWLACYHKLLWNFLWLSCFDRSPYMTFYDFPVFCMVVNPVIVSSNKIFAFVFVFCCFPKMLPHAAIFWQDLGQQNCQWSWHSLNFYTIVSKESKKLYFWLDRFFCFFYCFVFSVYVSYFISKILVQLLLVNSTKSSHGGNQQYDPILRMVWPGWPYVAVRGNASMITDFSMPFLWLRFYLWKTLHDIIQNKSIIHLWKSNHDHPWLIETMPRSWNKWRYDVPWLMDEL